MSAILDKAREYESLNRADMEKPLFHVAPPVGWMNDPNGFVCFGGLYHIFFQYHPYSTKWGPMHWGHAVSSNLVDWKLLPCALAPDQSYDCDGCFSGTAIPISDEKLLLMYTGVEGKRQTQCIAVGDGLDFEKCRNNPVIETSQLPEGSLAEDFRDPRIIRAEDGSFVAIVGGKRAKDHLGQLLVYRSEDAMKWKYAGKLAENNKNLGHMWECPDYFTLDGKKVLLYSAQHNMSGLNRYAGGNFAIVEIGEEGGAYADFRSENDALMDHGIDFYAPQTLETGDGRRIMIAWMQNWDSLDVWPMNLAWFGQMTLPRELKLKDGKLIQIPVREILERRRGAREITGGRLRGRHAELLLDVKDRSHGSFCLRFASDEIFYTSLTVDFSLCIISLDRSHSGVCHLAVNRSEYQFTGDEVTLDLFLDTHSAELFINGGEAAMSMTIPTGAQSDRITFHALQDVEYSGTFYELS